MKSFTILCLLVAFVSARPGEKYTDKYDNVDVKEILSNRPLLVSYIKCLLNKGKCTSEGNELKSHMKDALQNHCEKCTDAQKSGTRLVIRHMINEEPAYWKELSDLYDKDGKFVVIYEKELKTIKA